MIAFISFFVFLSFIETELVVGKYGGGVGFWDALVEKSKTKKRKKIINNNI